MSSIEELQNGSQQAFEAFVKQHSHRVINTCFRFVQSKEDAEDIAQEVFIELYKSIRQFRKEADLTTWLYRICVNKSLDFLRKKKRKKRISNLKELLLFKRKPVITPHQRLEEDERRELLQSQIAELPENQRISLVLSQYNRISNKQIAEIMEISESAVESLLHRARTNLRKNISDYFEKNL